MVMRLIQLLAAFVLLVGWFGCRSSEQPDDYVARVSDAYLTEAEIREKIAEYSALRDTASARKHIIDNWVTDQLLYREARRQDVARDSAVRARLEEVRRSVLIEGLIRDLKEDVPPPSETSVQTYYQRHQEQLRLQEPFLRVYYLVTPDRGTLASIRARLTTADDSAAVDSIRRDAVDRIDRNSQRSRKLSDSYLPLSRLQRELPSGLLDPGNLESGALSPIVENNGAFHLVQIIDRMEEGTLPPLEHVHDKILQQLMIQEKKLMYTREVQRLRTRARADNTIEIRN